jgi:hypothetical protein
MPAIGQFPEVNRVVPDVALLDHLQHVRPDGGVKFFVFFKLFGAEADD